MVSECFKKQVTRPFAVLNLSPSLLSLSPDFTRHNNAKCLAPPRPQNGTVRAREKTLRDNDKTLLEP